MRQMRPRDRVVQENSDKYVINEQIRAPQVRLIGGDGEQIGIIPTRDAMRLAEEQGLDLVEVSAEANPPVCRLLDFGKLKYKEQKKAADARKKAATHSVKELRVRYNTDKHDLETKIRNAKKFLEDGDKVRFQMRFRGRESVYRELGEQLFRQIAETLSETATVEETTPLLGQRMTMTLGPKSAAAK